MDLRILLVTQRRAAKNGEWKIKTISQEETTPDGTGAIGLGINGDNGYRRLLVDIQLPICNFYWTIRKFN